MSLSQLSFLIALAMSGPCASAVAATAQVPGNLRACLAENDDARRLACYDRELGRQSADGIVAAGFAVPAAAAQASPKDEFGVRGSDVARQREKQQQEAGLQVERLTGKVQAISKHPRGEIVVTLENGQVWQQKKPEAYFPLKIGDEISINQGALGSYRLSAPSGRSTPVTRVR